MIYFKTSYTDPIPPYSGTPGSLIEILDYLLVTVMGWTKEFSGTNLAAYKQPAGSNGYYLRIDDTNATYARAVGYETMSDINTGTNMFPDTTQFPGGFYINKPEYSYQRHLIKFVSNGTYFTLLGWVYQDCVEVFTFGDIFSNKPVDPYATVIAGSTTSSLSGSPAFLSCRSYVDSSITNRLSYLARNVTGTVISAPCDRVYDGKSFFSDLMERSSYQQPTTIGGLNWLSPLWIYEANYVTRGAIPGTWVFTTDSRAIANGEKLNIGGNRVIERIQTSSTYLEGFCIEVSDTWGGIIG